MAAAAVAVLACRARALTRGGGWAAFTVGAITYTAGGWPAAAVLFSFFLPSLALSRLGRARKRDLLDIGKHGPRNALQVFANGGVAALCVFAAGIAHRDLWMVAFSGAFAAACADTWGTEIGTLVRALPRSIVTLKPLATGLSGGITPLGTLAEIAGALSVAGIAWLVRIAPFAPVAAAGFAGAVIDSLLGDTLQERRWCERCARECETNPHHCGQATRRARGYAWMNNDTVNACATLCGALVALVLMR